MKLKDFERLKKMLNLTMSENDGEALNSIRAANKIITNSGVDWDRIMNKLVSIDVESFEEAEQNTIKPKQTVPKTPPKTE